MPKNEHPKVFGAFWCTGEGRRPGGVPRGGLGMAVARGVVHGSCAGVVDRARGRVAASDRLAHAARSTETVVQWTGHGDTWQPLIGGLTRRGPRRRAGERWTGARPCGTLGWPAHACVVHATREQAGLVGTGGAGGRLYAGPTWRPAIGSCYPPALTGAGHTAAPDRLGAHCPVFETHVAPRLIRALVVWAPLDAFLAPETFERPKLCPKSEVWFFLGCAYK